MPIEFHCTDCAKLLRVADESQGKACYCPNCNKLLTIPSFSPPEPKSIVAAKGEIEVPCPKCKYLLKCDATLEGTRGCCASCAHVFTISTHAMVQEVEAEVFAFACPKCGQLFEGKPEMEGRKGKCTGCASVFIIERHTPKPSNATQSTQQVESKQMSTLDNAPNTATAKPKPATKLTPTAKPTPATKRTSATSTSSTPSKGHGGTSVGSSSSPSKPVAKPMSSTPMASSLPNDPLGGLDLSNMIPSATAPTYANTYPATPTIAIKASKRHRKSDSGKVVLKALAIVAGIFGVSLLLCCGGVGIFFYAMSGKQTITLAGYSVSAPATQRVNAPSPANTQAVQLANRFTKSHFAMLHLQQPGLTTELYMQGLAMQGRVMGRQPVSRAGLAGIHFEYGGGGGLPKHIGEAFQTNQGVILLMYANGADLAVLEGKSVRMDRNQTQGMDKPDEFFASLRPSSP